MGWIKSIPPKMVHDMFGLYSGQWMPEMDRCWIREEDGCCVCSRIIRTDWGNIEHVTITRSQPDQNGPIVTNDGSGGFTWREKQNIKNRQPLQLMQVAMNDREGAEVIRSFSDLIREELNIKQLEILDEVDSIATVSYKPCFPVISQKYPQQRGSIIKAVQTGRFTIAEDKVRLEVNGEEQELDSDVLLVSYEARKGMHVASENGVVLSLDTTITEELRREGIAREVIRNIQDARKNMNYNITDRIALAAEGDIPAEWMDYIASETLGTFGTVDRPDTTVEIGEGKHRITVAIARI